MTNQFPGVVFSLEGGPDSSGAPYASSIWEEHGHVELNNSSTSDYPSANILDIAFAGGTFGVSFTYNNYGENNAFYTAYDIDHNVVSSGFLGEDLPYHLVEVAGSGIYDLKIDNNQGDDSWVFGLKNLSFGAVPEPASWVLMIGGFGLVGTSLRRRRATLAA